jgi:hypothetical protein
MLLLSYYFFKKGLIGVLLWFLFNRSFFINYFFSLNIKYFQRIHIIIITTTVITTTNNIVILFLLYLLNTLFIISIMSLNLILLLLLYKWIFWYI